MMASRPLSRGAQPLSEHRSAFGAGPEFSHPEYSHTSSEGHSPRNHPLESPQPALDRNQIFALSKSTPPLDELYGATIRYNLGTHAEGQSALDSCLRQEK